MIDLTRLIDAFDLTGEQHLAARLAPFCDELAAQLRERGADALARHKKGAVGLNKACTTAADELDDVARQLRAAGLAALAPSAIEATEAIATQLRESVADFTPGSATMADPVAALLASSRTPSPVETSPIVEDDLGDGPACGQPDPFAASLTREPDVCIAPAGHEGSHQGAWSRWPNPRRDDPLLAQQLAEKMGIPAELIDIASDPDPVDVMEEQGRLYVQARREPFMAQAEAYLKGDTDVLPTPDVGLETATTEVPDMQPSQPDPFDNALPEQVVRTATWRPTPDPRPLWLPRVTVPLIPASIRTTHVRVGEECGLAYRLLTRDEVPEVPAWWNVGGTTLHECARLIEFGIINGNQAETVSERDARSMWAEQFADQIAVLQAETPFPMHQWRAANKGTEGQDWWNEVGPLMARDYSAASARWHADGWSILNLPQIGPATELAMRMPMRDGGELTGHLDQAWYRLDEGDEWEIRVRDLKAGRELPTDTWQLEAYTLELRTTLAGHPQRGAPLVGGLDRCRFSAVYYDARNGKDGEVINLTAQNAAEIHYRAGSVLRMHETNNYPANPRDGYGGPCYLCAVRYACPIMAMKS